MSAPDANGWMDISTAPKDGSDILGVRGDVRKIVRWDADKYNSKPKPYWSTGFGGKTWDRDHPPTHWQPLPKPPVLV